MTRDDDRYLTLDERAAVAQRLGRKHVRFAAHGQRAQSARARSDDLFAVRRRLRRRGGARWRLPTIAAGQARASGGSVAAMLSDLAIRDQMNASAEFATRRRRQVRRPVRASPAAAPLRRFPRASPRRRAGHPVRGRLYQQCRRRAAAARPRAPQGDRRLRWPRRSKPTSPRDRASNPNFSPRAGSALDARPNEVRPSDRPVLAASGPGRLQPASARARRPVVGTPLGPLD